MYVPLPVPLCFPLHVTLSSPRHVPLLFPFPHYSTSPLLSDTAMIPCLFLTLHPFLSIRLSLSLPNALDRAFFLSIYLSLFAHLFLPRIPYSQSETN